MGANLKAKNPRILKVALIQMCPKPYALKENLRLGLKLAKDSLKNGVNLVVFPELFDSGYCVAPNDKDFALDFAKPKKHATFKALSAFAKENALHIIACGIEKSNKKLYDTAYIIAPSGKCVGKHRKIYLWGEEKSRFHKGKKYEVFSLDFGTFRAKVGLQICYEIGFGVGANILALKGAEVLIYPSAFGAARAYNWDLLSKARAVENGCFILACNHSGTESNTKSIAFAGDSQIISPQGKIIKKATKLNEVIIAQINLDEIYPQREAIPYLKDFDPKLTKRSFGKST